MAGIDNIPVCIRGKRSFMTPQAVCPEFKVNIHIGIIRILRDKQFVYKSPIEIRLSTCSTMVVLFSQMYIVFS